jgi:hypothetical protein
MIDEDGDWTDADLTRKHLASPSHFNSETFWIVNFLAALRFIHWMSSLSANFSFDHYQLSKM